MDDDSQQILVGCGVCIDPEYNILWTYSPDGNKVASFNPVTSNIQGTYLPTVWHTGVGGMRHVLYISIVSPEAQSRG